jgi:hypothetical protein
VVGSKGAPGVGIGSINIDSNGDLIVDLDNGQTVNAGQAVPTISIGTVTQNPSGLGSSATLTGTAPDYVLNLELDTSATTGNFVGTVLLTSQGLTADSATRKDYVDQQITQTANQTKINNLAFSIVFGA